MRTIQNTTRWLGLVLAGSIITLAASGQAGKPVKPPKPPPEPPPSAAYDVVLLGDPGAGSYARDVNEPGMVVGKVYSPDGYDHLTLVVPEEDNGTPLWRKDVDLDGRNDLLIDLGIPPQTAGNPSLASLNDHGVVLGAGSRLIPATGESIEFAWILSPQVVDGQLTWTDLDNAGVNWQITPLPVLAADDPHLHVNTSCINNHGAVTLDITFFVSPYERWYRGFLLIPSHYEVSPDGAVAIHYPATDLNGDGLNDYLIDLGSGVSHLDEAVLPLLPSAINDRGDVAGTVLGVAGGNNGRPFVIRPRLDENLGLVWNEDQDGDGVNDLALYLPLPAEDYKAGITDMNENGTIVGWVYNNSDGGRAAIWQMDWETGTSSVTRLESLERKYDKSEAAAVNAAGQVVGRSLKYTRDAVYQKAWLWDQGTMVPLGDLVSPETGLADNSSIALGINDSAMIVGAQQSVYPGDWTSFIAVPVAGQ